jgi:hypothetical protein
MDTIFKGTKPGALPTLYRSSHEECLCESERLLNNVFRCALDEPDITRFRLVINGAKLVAEDDALRFRVTGGERDGKSIFTREPPALGDRTDQHETGAKIERPRGQRKHRSAASLLGAERRV